MHQQNNVNKYATHPGLALFNEEEFVYLDAAVANLASISGSAAGTLMVANN